MDLNPTFVIVLNMLRLIKDLEVDPIINSLNTFVFVLMVRKKSLRQFSFLRSQC